MSKKNSMYMNDYEVSGFTTNTTTKESKNNYLNYIQSLINELEDLKNYADISEPKIKMFFECQSKLISLKNKLNARTLAEWHTNVTYELEKEVEKLRK